MVVTLPFISGVHIFEDTLRVHIHRLRQKTEETPAQPRYILTERGLGYKFPVYR